MSKNKREERINDENVNYQGCSMKVVQYNSTNNIIVEFQDEYKCKVQTRYNLFLNGQIKNPYYPTVYDVGVVGNKYPVCVKHKIIKEYDAWFDMLRRCCSKKYKDKKPTYENVSCCKEWLFFENFYEWLHSQSNFEKWLHGKRWAIDKDILVKGNKVYSPETCCLVPQNVNSLFVKSNAVRGDLPIGVQKHQKKYRACFNIFNKYVKLPVKNSINEAFTDYKIYKEHYIKQIAKIEYSNGNITKRCYDAMINYKVEITD